MKRILILCTGNSARSQIAEAFIKQLTFGRVDVYSAGIDPVPVNPYAIRVMKEIGIDISGNKSKSVNEFYNQAFDFIITVCDNAREKCPLFQGSHTKIHKSFNDPVQVKGKDKIKIETFRKVRDQIRDWVTEFIEKYQIA
jgi:arsenate reductase